MCLCLTEWKGGGWEAFTLQNKNEMTTFQCSAVSRTNLKRLRNCGKMRRSTWTSTNDMLPSIISFNAYSATSSNTSAVMPNRRQSLLIFLVLLQLTGKTLDNCNKTCLLLNSNGTIIDWADPSCYRFPKPVGQVSFITFKFARFVKPRKFQKQTWEKGCHNVYNLMLFDQKLHREMFFCTNYLATLS